MMTDQRALPRVTYERGWWFRRAAFVTSAVLVLVGAVALFAPPAPSGDTLFHIIYADDLLSGQSYGGGFGPTPHPMILAMAALVAPLDPTAGYYAVAYFGYVLFAGLVVVTYLLAATAFGRAAGIVASGIIIISAQFVALSLSTSLDAIFAALLAFAALLEMRHPRAGSPVLLVLAIAGLVRPEAWPVAIFYYFYARPALHGRNRKLAPLIAVLGPGAWLVVDLVVTGNPLYSLTYTQEGASALGRRTGLRDAVLTLPEYVGGNLRLPVVTGASLAFVAAACLSHRRHLPILSGAALFALAYLGLGVVEVSLLDRYTIVLQLFLVALFSHAVTGWVRQPAGRIRTAWIAVAAVLGIGVVAALPGQVDRLDSQRDGLRARAAALTDLLALSKEPQVARLMRDCAPRLTPGYRAIALLSYSTGLTAATFTPYYEQVPTGGTVLVARTDDVLDKFLFSADDPQPAAVARPVQKPVAVNESWAVFSSCRA